MLVGTGYRLPAQTAHDRTLCILCGWVNLPSYPAQTAHIPKGVQMCGCAANPEQSQKTGDRERGSLGDI